jgi:subtilisin family serine protease/subtilisin-like proprotein convertase family protein
MSPARRSLLPRSRSRRTCRLHVELLEDRRLLYAADLFAAGRFDPTHILIGDSAGQVQKVNLPAGLSVEQALAQYESDPLVAYAEPDFLVSAAVLPSDAQFSQQYAQHNLGQSGGLADADIDNPEAWDAHTGSTRIAVGVIDTGIDYNHPDLYLNIWINQDEIPAAIRANLTDTDSDGRITFYDLNQPINVGPGKITDLNANGRIDGGDLLASGSGWEDGIDQDPYLVGASTVSRIDDLVGWNFVSNTNNPFDDNGHGTHVAGTIGAMGNNGVGVAGVAWQAQLAALKFLSASGSGSISAATAAVYYAVANGLDITNNSWGGGGFSQSFANALSVANAAGQIFVAAAGNNGSNNDSISSYPSNYNFPNVVAVAATDRRDLLASFSNYGLARVDLGAPGVSIRSTYPSGSYATLSGTSMAAPQVSGALALLLSSNPDLTGPAAIGAILSTADPVAALASRVATGGRLNVNDAIRLDFEPPPPPTDTTGPSVTAAVPNGTTAVSGVRVTFSEAINPATFDATDVSLVGPGGSIAVLGVTPSGFTGTQFDITFATQTAGGAYSLTVGPDIRDLASNAMDAAFAGSFTIVSTQTFTNTTPAAIRDRVNTFSFITIGQGLTIADLNVRLNISHTYDSDLFIELRHPDGTTVVLSNRRGGSGNNFTNTLFDDEASVAIASGAAPFAGSFRPESPLAALDGRSAQGTWRLRVFDAASLDIGTLNSWSLIVTAGAGPASAQEESIDAVVAAFSLPEIALAFGSLPVRDAGVSDIRTAATEPADVGSVAVRHTAIALAQLARHQPASASPAPASDVVFAELAHSGSPDEFSDRMDGLLELVRSAWSRSLRSRNL